MKGRIGLIGFERLACFLLMIIKPSQILRFVSAINAIPALGGASA
jgi:hypothetical protein